MEHIKLATILELKVKNTELLKQFKDDRIKCSVGDPFCVECRWLVSCEYLEEYLAEEV